MGGAAKVSCRSGGTLPFSRSSSLVASSAKPCRRAICSVEDAWLTKALGEDMLSKQLFAQKFTIHFGRFHATKMVSYVVL